VLIQHSVEGRKRRFLPKTAGIWRLSLLKGLGYGIRLLIVIHLLDRERSVADLLSRIGCSQASLSQHLSKLVELEVVQGHYHRGRRYYSCKSHDAKQVIRFLDRLAKNDKLPSRKYRFVA
jgi:DNA-binding transcriptional ArsR family regulator